MKISEKFTDYGLIGGFFWTLEAVLVLSLGVAKVVSIDWGQILRSVDRIPSGVLSPLSALLGALVLIAIFTTGLILDLIGSWAFRAIEVGTFGTHARHNALWMEKLINRHEEYIQNDWKMILSVPSLSWKTLYRGEFKLKTFAARASYTRVQAFLLAYVQLSSRGEKFDLLTTQLSLWSTSRAISAALYVLSFQLALYSLPALYSHGEEPNVVAWLIAIIVCFILITIAWVITAAAFGRVCSSIFALAYIMSEAGASQTRAD